MSGFVILVTRPFKIFTDLSFRSLLQKGPEVKEQVKNLKFVSYIVRSITAERYLKGPYLSRQK